MFEIFTDLGLTHTQWVLAALCGALVGMAKTGLNALGLIVVVIFAAIFGGKASTGILLPLLCVADIFAVYFYNKHANLKIVFKLLPWVLAGIIAGLLTGNSISDKMFKIIIGTIVLICTILMLCLDKGLKDSDLSRHRWLSIPAGFLGGFATMIGNAAGPIITIYLLSMALPKNKFIGTGAWFFLIINVIKLPFHFFIWNTISTKTLFFDLTLIPMIILGAFSGVFLVKKIPNREYKLFIMASTIISAGILILKNI